VVGIADALNLFISVFRKLIEGLHELVGVASIFHQGNKLLYVVRIRGGLSHLEIRKHYAFDVHWGMHTCLMASHKSSLTGTADGMVDVITPILRGAR
jgi:hypothetical protein